MGFWDRSIWPRWNNNGRLLWRWLHLIVLPLLFFRLVIGFKCLAMLAICERLYVALPSPVLMLLGAGPSCVKFLLCGLWRIRVDTWLVSLANS